MTPFNPARRRWLARATLGLAGVSGLAFAAGVREAARVKLTELDASVRDLPAAFEGLRVAVLADFHLGPFVSAAFVRRVVDLTNDLSPDLVLLPGDFAHKGHSAREQLPVCFAEVARFARRSACSRSPATTTCSTAVAPTANSSPRRRSPT